MGCKTGLVHKFYIPFSFCSINQWPVTSGISASLKKKKGDRDQTASGLRSSFFCLSRYPCVIICDPSKEKELSLFS